MKKHIIAGIAVVFILAVVASAVVLGSLQGDNVFKGYTAEVYYTTTCGCCVNYIGYLRDSGVNVKTVALSQGELDRMKADLGVPSYLQSCHTTKIGGYFVEGHIPLEAVKKLLEEKPKIDGIALGGMPSGSPGMPGRKTSPLDIQSVAMGSSKGTFFSG